ncbi:AzlC family ABC transporter permease (plasmid) [Niallia taxi]|uniref:AzlC family ABC transporter permease n=1 Tax=Niallia taxi TaxID=2499688 RepID=UPI0023AA15EF|nr:AzlC family ABC transporter permease [Niallia taxi]MDE5052758.1 AzlC family ABC transporter permease [Niallia taxi]MED3963127.1 AzlC family ABC transporter permease [Niallia taxi]WOD65403.1 AzlC family ABC transporter permease [Niallia taxi]
MSLNTSYSHITQRSETDDSFFQGVRACIPTLFAYLSIGFACGIVQKTAGLSLAEISLLTLFVYSGSAQFIVASMYLINPPIAVITTIFFVNLRHLLLSAALSPFFQHVSPFRNMLIGAILTDETFGVALQKSVQKNNISEKWMHGLNITAYINWFIANLSGAYLAQWITNTDALGLEFALPAIFIGLLVITIAERKTLLSDLVVCILAVLLLLVISLWFSSSLSILIATIIAASMGMVMSKWK